MWVNYIRDCILPFFVFFFFSTPLRPVPLLPRNLSLFVVLLRSRCSAFSFPKHLFCFGAKRDIMATYKLQWLRLFTFRQYFKIICFLYFSFVLFASAYTHTLIILFCAFIAPLIPQQNQITCTYMHTYFCCLACAVFGLAKPKHEILLTVTFSRL